jgi:hypothetical protein
MNNTVWDVSVSVVVLPYQALLSLSGVSCLDLKMSATECVNISLSSPETLQMLEESYGKAAVKKM